MPGATTGSRPRERDVKEERAKRLARGAVEAPTRSEPMKGDASEKGAENVLPGA